MHIRKLLKILFLTGFIQSSCQAQFSNLSFMKDSFASVGKENAVYALGIGASCLGLYTAWSYLPNIKNSILQGYPLRFSSEIDEEQEKPLSDESLVNKIGELKEKAKKLEECSAELKKEKKEKSELIQNFNKLEQKNNNLKTQIKKANEEKVLAEENLKLLQGKIGLDYWQKRNGYNLENQSVPILAALVRRQAERIDDLQTTNKIEKNNKDKYIRAYWQENLELKNEIQTLKKTLENGNKKENHLLDSSFAMIDLIGGLFFWG